MSKSRQWIVLSLVLMLLGGLLFAYKVVRLGYPPLPDQTSEQWIIQARLELHPEQGPVRASLLLPTRSSGYTVSDEHFVSRGFGLTIEEDLFRRQADWAIRRLDEPKTLYYRAAVITDTRQRRFANTPQPPPVPELEEPWASAMADIMEEVQSESELHHIGDQFVSIQTFLLSGVSYGAADLGFRAYGTDKNPL